MSAGNPSSTAPSLRRLPFTVRLSPQLVNRLLSRTQRADFAHDIIHGLLFGLPDDNLLVIQAFRTFPGDTASSIEKNDPALQDEAFEQLLVTARKDPEISALELVGWYAARANGGLLQSDIQLHERHFKRPGDLALVLRPEGNTDVLLELYCRSANGALSEEGHRWGAVRLAHGSTLVGPVEVTMRAKIQDDFFMRAYQVTNPEDEGEQGPRWKSIVQFTTKRAFGILNSGKEKPLKAPETAQAPAKASEQATSLRDQAPASQIASGSPRQLHPEARNRSETSAPVPALKQLRSSSSGETERANRNARALQKIHAGAPPSVPTIIPEAPRKRGVPWVSSALVFAVAAGLTFGLVYSRGLSSGDYMPEFLKGFFAVPGLGLRLESQGDRVLLSWNRHHPAVRSAKGGVLQIDDGTQHRRVNLDSAQIANGSVLYRPNSDDVTFRLEIENEQGGKVSENMRVLETSKPSALDLSTPAETSSTNHPIRPPGEPGLAQGNRKMSGQTASSSTQTPAATQKVWGVTTGSPAAGTRAATSQPTLDQNPPSAPPVHEPLTIPVKPETPGGVSYDIASSPSVPGGKPEPAASKGSLTSETATRQTETAQNTTPHETGTGVPSSTTQRQNPISPPPNSTPPVNTPAQTNTQPPTVQPRANMLASYRAPRPLRQVLPNTALLPPGLLSTAGRVEVIVKVSESGRVTEAHVVNGAKKINSSLAGASILAARQWIFEPAKLGGTAVPSEHSIVFQFQPPK